MDVSASCGDDSGHCQYHAASQQEKYVWAFVSSAISMSVLLIIVAIELYPTILLSSGNPEYSLTVYNASSSQKSLGIMLTIAAIGVPLVAVYTSFVF